MSDRSGEIQASLPPACPALVPIKIELGGVVDAERRSVVQGTGKPDRRRCTVIGDVSNGRIAPGNSTGDFAIEGDLQGPGTIAFELAGTAAYDQLLVSGSANLGDVLEIDLINGFTPALSDYFQLLTFDTLIDSGLTFELTCEPLQAGLSWDTTHLATTGAISVAPEPTTWLLAALGSLALFGVDRRCCQ